MARPRTIKDDEGEAAASLEVPVGPVSNLTPYERAQIAQQAEVRRQFLASEKQRKENDLRTDRDLAAESGVLTAKVKAVIVAHFADDPAAEDTVASMMRAIEPVLAAGKMGARRERRLYAAVPKRAA